jgi:hypothetical protein
MFNMSTSKIELECCPALKNEALLEITHVFFGRITPSCSELTTLGKDILHTCILLVVVVIEMVML